MMKKETFLLQKKSKKAQLKWSYVALEKGLYKESFSK